MATSAVSSHGTLLQVKKGGSFATIAEVLDFTGPGTTLNTEDATNHDSNGNREIIPTLKEPGEVTFDINYSKDSTQTDLRTALTNSTLLELKIVFPLTSPTTEALTFSGYVTNFEYAAPVEGILRASVTITVSGAVTSGAS